tara:strand:+ start:2601 stop:2996 length:396 start_codon:yes stop_codon:yes gene_type:complete
MNPKRPKDFIKPTAEILEQSETLVDDVIGFYWSTVRKALSELGGPSITVTNLGTFKVRYKKIKALEKKHQMYLDSLEVDHMTFAKHTLQNISKKKLEGLDNIRKQMEEEFKRKQEVRTKRKKYIDEKALGK